MTYLSALLKRLHQFEEVCSAAASLIRDLYALVSLGTLAPIGALRCLLVRTLVGRCLLLRSSCVVPCALVWIGDAHWSLQK
jgi:hypothetical protein